MSVFFLLLQTLLQTEAKYLLSPDCFFGREHRDHSSRRLILTGLCALDTPREQFTGLRVSLDCTGLKFRGQRVGLVAAERIASEYEMPDQQAQARILRLQMLIQRIYPCQILFKRVRDAEILRLDSRAQTTSDHYTFSDGMRIFRRLWITTVSTSQAVAYPLRSLDSTMHSLREAREKSIVFLHLEELPRRRSV